MEHIELERSIEDVSYSKMFMESMYRLQLVENETKFLRSINAIYCNETGNTVGLELLVEGVGENIKNFVTKLWNGIVKMWNSFVGKLEELVGAEKKWLESNKDTIFKKVPKKVSIGTYKYDITKLQNTWIPKYDADKIKKIEDQNSFSKELLSSMKIQQQENESVSDAVKKWIRGSSEQVTLLSSDLNMADLYNYCYDFKNVKNKIKLELDALDATKNDILTIANTVSKQMDQNTNTNESIFYYGSVLDIISEAKIGDDSKDSGNTSTSGAKVGDSKSLSANMTNSADDQGKPDDDKVKSDVKDMKTQGNDLDDIQQKISIYYKVCGQVLAAKLNVASEIFKEYMQILRWHVNSFTVSEKKTKDKTGAAAKATDYSQTSVKEEEPK